MSKADRLRRLKRKREAKDLPHLAATPKRKARGRDRMAQIAAERAADAGAMDVVIAARIARGAKDADAARDPLHGSDMGRCILALTDDRDRRDVTEAWAAMSAAWANYCTRILGRPLGPQSAAIAFLPDRIEADPSLRIDLRTPDEKDAAAKAAWAHWHARIAALPTPMHGWTLRGALQGFMGDEVLWRDGQPTKSGRLAVVAIRMLTR